MSAPSVVVCGGFDDIQACDLRFLEEAAKLGDLTVLLCHDRAWESRTGTPPKFSLAERRYFLGAVRSVHRVIEVDECDVLPAQLSANIWVDIDTMANSARAKCAGNYNMAYRILTAEDLTGLPEPPYAPLSCKKKVAVTGCYDWLHTGHIRFFEEASAFGDLYVFLGNDKCIRELKGEGHPLLSQDKRRYVVGSIRFVTQAVISSGSGWIDADKEIRALKPDMWIVNEDGDKGDKQDYCRSLGIEYRVLERVPAPGLPKRSSTALRGF